MRLAVEAIFENIAENHVKNFFIKIQINPAE